MDSQSFYDNADLWKNYDGSDEIMKKVEFLKKFIPADVHTIIDIGCGNGIITNEFSKQFFTVGLDVSRPALRYVNKNAVLASCDKLPVKKNSFDLVFSSELLEHLDGDTLVKTINEIKRLSKKFVMITVPNNENLSKRKIKCPKCSYIFHADHHLNSFTEKSFLDLLGSDYQHIRTEYFGPLDRNYSRFLLLLRQYIARQWWYYGRTYIMCSKCKNTDFQFPQANILSKLLNGLNRIVSGKKPYWMFILFKNKNITD